MLRTGIILLFVASSRALFAQDVRDEPGQAQEAALEDLSAETESDIKDEYMTQQLEYLVHHPLNVNGDESALSDCPLLDAPHIAALLTYRKALGDLVSPYELQAVPGFDVQLIRQLLPYITIGDTLLSARSLHNRLRGGEETLLFRPAFTPERANGFRMDSSGARKYAGARPGGMIRYTYKKGDLLQFGLLLDQDPGEQLHLSSGQWLTDFHSLHVFARHLGAVKALALGDFTVNLGQGLIQWQSMAFTKSANAMNIKRESEVLRPYHSAGEYNFFRGVGITLQRRAFELTLFGSSRRLSANRSTDSSGYTIATALQPGGLHRTEAEREDRNWLSATAWGGNAQWKMTGGHIGVNAVITQYGNNIFPRPHPYNIYAMHGNHWMNLSADFSYTIDNYHVFGELATDQRRSIAGLVGIMTSLSRSTDFSALIRVIPPSYASVYGHAFTENTMPSNERGLYMGMHIQATPAVTTNFYADVFQFPWLKYRVDAPGFGSEYAAQLQWTPRKTLTWTFRARSKVKPINESSGASPRPRVVNTRLRDIRTDLGIDVNRQVHFSTRFEACWFDTPAGGPVETGYLSYVDLRFRPRRVRLTAAVRLQHFETGSHDTRLYAYERDVAFATSTPAFFGIGDRVYVDLKMPVRLAPRRRWVLNLNLKCGRTVYAGQSSVGSGTDEIQVPHKTDVRFQVFLERG